MKKTASVLFLLLFALYPLWYGGGYRTLERDKYPVFLLLCGLLTALLLVFAVKKLLKNDRRISVKTVPVYAVFAAALLLFLTISAIFSPYPDRVWLGGQRRDGLLTWALYLGTFFATAKWGKLTRAHTAALGLCFVFTAVLAFVQQLDLNPLGLYPEGYTFSHRGSGFLSTLGNVDFLSAFSVLGTVLLLGDFVTGAKKTSWIPLTGLAFATLSLRLSGAQTGRVALVAALFIGLWFALQNRTWCRRYFLGIAVILAAMALLACFHNQKTPDGRVVLFYPTAKTLRRLVLLVPCLLAALAAKKLPVPAWVRRHRTAALLLFMTGIVLAVAAVLFFFGSSFGTTAAQLQMLLHGKLPKRLGSGRFAIWEQMWTLIREKPLLGGGPDTVGLRNLAGRADNAHSIFLQLWVNGGIFSLLSFCLLLGAVLLPAFRRKSKGDFLYTLPVIAYLVHAAVSVDEFIVAPVFWAVLGLLAAQRPQLPPTET